MNTDVVMFQSELTDLANRANECHSRFESAASAAFAYAVECGHVLIEAQPKVAPGEWLNWVDANLNFSRTSVTRYMRVAAYAKELSDANIASVHEAEDYLRDRGLRRTNVTSFQRLPMSDQDLAQAQRARAAGLTYREIGEIVGQNHQVVMERLDKSIKVKRQAREKRRQRERRDAKRLLEKQELATKIRKIGGQPSIAYALLRKASLAIDSAMTDTEDQEVYTKLRKSLNAITIAEAELVDALGLGRRTGVNTPVRRR